MNKDTLVLNLEECKKQDATVTILSEEMIEGEKTKTLKFSMTA